MASSLPSRVYLVWLVKSSSIVFPLDKAVYPCPWAKKILLGIHTATHSKPTPCTLCKVMQMATLNVNHVCLADGDSLTVRYSHI